ncbi:hypothetical protein CWS43_26030 [Rahnella sp. AA]|uniref:hypothetical protein n=1 Tax=Rahnella sp. AA TaxID=2057180 RepID=UPI000C322B86|nr:hypothetical protein [Rahnella sp. AA]PKE27585.1 hypothetical protein CWS43_26030 [Rahnella sp. AA]
MHGENVLMISFFGLHGFMFTDSGTEHQRVCFKTRPGLDHDPLKVAIARLAHTTPENLTWDASCGEGSFCLLTASVSAGTFPLPYEEEK